MVLYLAWLTMTVLRFGGVMVVFAGVALFGIYFIGGNARAAQNSQSAVPRSSWQGAGPRKGMRIAAVGVLMLLGAYIISLLMPNGT